MLQRDGFFVYINHFLILLFPRNSSISLSSVFNFRLPSIASLASMSAPRSSVVISLSFITAMIATSFLQNYKKVIEYGWFFSKNLK